MRPECVSCGEIRPLCCRSLCGGCRGRHRRDGTIGDWGWVKADRVREYASLRRLGDSVPVAAVRTGVSVRTGWRYEAQLSAGRRAA
jgi:hypothetical protein